jgi:glycosyltransferase involved in cell wall biosynthesis
MNLGRRDKVPFPASYKDFALIRTHGRVYGIPPSLKPDGMLKSGMLFRHPAILSAPNLDDIREQIDRFDYELLKIDVVGQCENHDLIRHRGALYAIPRGAGRIDPDLPEERRRAGVLTAPTQDELEEKIRKFSSAAPVEFAGWLPIFQFSGNCGTHPQFTHTSEPPAGYRFTSSEPAPGGLLPARWKLALASIGKKISKAVSDVNALLRIPMAFLRPRKGIALRTRWNVFASLFSFMMSCFWRGCKFIPTLRFVQSRHLQSQLLAGESRELVFLTSMPFTYGQNPWVIEIEDPTTLFYPLIQNGQTSDLSVKDSPYFPVVKTLLEGDHCKGIVTHMRSTANLVSTLFDSEIIRRKIMYAPLGVRLPAHWQRHEEQPDDEPIHILFINSWCQVPGNFYVRGGLDILEAFDTLRIRYPQLRLTMRTALPELDAHYHRIMETGWVRTFHRFVTAEEMAELHATSHIYLLPAARVHIVSLLQAMSYGLAVVASDGWGIEEYLTHERNGLIVKGRYGKTSWADEEAGVLREDYEPMYTPDPQVVEGIIEAVSRLVEDRMLRAKLGRAARGDVENRFNMKQWNQGLQRAFDRARGIETTTTMGMPLSTIEENQSTDPLHDMLEAQRRAG